MVVLADWINFYFPTKIHLEVDCSYKVGNYIGGIGNRIVVITTQKEMQNTGELSVVKSSIEKSAEGVIIYDDIESEATLKDLDTAAHFARQSQANCIIAYGSYDSVNAAKCVSLLTTNDMFADELIIGHKETVNPPLPLVIIPTMPLMGLECAPFCTIADNRDRQRRYFSHPGLFPELVISDAKIGLHLTSSDISKIAISVLAASIDTLLSKYANELTIATTVRAIELVYKNILISIRDTKNLVAKHAIFSASLLTGISQSIASLGLCYALSLATISLTKLDIFQAMSILLPHVLEYNLTASAGKYVLIARALDEDITDISVIEAAIRAVEGVRKIYNELRIPQKLSEYEVKKADLSSIASLAISYPFLESLQRELPKNEIETILIAAY
ncbi:MAG: iron-containing alcohol dehydrogenase [Leptospiraceae bacterium]|nr:iron-containing alcohol dehydrogenase [Leptospiraceae bacterium]MCP5495850.1 iron-containing alcohol dehydrogenase [Leptospiraceae bacterium]